MNYLQAHSGVYIVKCKRCGGEHIELTPEAQKAYMEAVERMVKPEHKDELWIAFLMEWAVPLTLALEMLAAIIFVIFFMWHF